MTIPPEIQAEAERLARELGFSDLTNIASMGLVQLGVSLGLDVGYELAIRTIATALMAQRQAALEKAAKKIRMFQDMVGWQKGESRNALVGEIEDAIRTLAKEGQP